MKPPNNRCSVRGKKTEIFFSSSVGSFEEEGDAFYLSHWAGRGRWTAGLLLTQWSEMFQLFILMYKYIKQSLTLGDKTDLDKVILDELFLRQGDPLMFTDWLFYPISLGNLGGPGTSFPSRSQAASRSSPE